MFFSFLGKKNYPHDPFQIQENGVFGRLKNTARRQWTEDFFLHQTLPRERVGQEIGLAAFSLVFVVVMLLAGLLLGRTAWLQVAKGEYYYDLAEGNRIRLTRLEPKRGIIYDRRLVPLVRNVSNFLLYLVPADLPSDQEARAGLLAEISQLVGPEPAAEMTAALAMIPSRSLEIFQPLFVADNIPYEQAMRIFLKINDWPGVFLDNKTRREYNQLSPSLSHVLGYIGKISAEEIKSRGPDYLPIDYIGKMGVEYFWENELRGQNGQKQVEVNALGKEKKIISQKLSQDGQNLILSVDVLAQKKLEEILLAYLKKLKLNKAVAIALDPANGEIIALVSLPAYNNNIFARGITSGEYRQLLNDPDKPLFNRAVSGEFPSGSTIKPLWAAAALEEGIINENTTFLSTGGLRIGEWFFPDWRAGGHGQVNVRRAIAESVNTFFYYIGGGYEDFQGLGIDRLRSYGEKFGLGAQTGIDLTGESTGLLPSPSWKEEQKQERWYIGDTYHVAIGQGNLLVTPLQVAAYTAVFANGGVLYRPHLVRNIVSADLSSAFAIDNVPVRSGFISPKNINIVRQGMRQAVTAGSARRLNSLPVAAAGKTGTAQWAKDQPEHAWFTGFAPWEEPRIVVTVLVEAAGEGSDIAVPIVEEFWDWYFRRDPEEE